MMNGIKQEIICENTPMNENTNGLFFCSHLAAPTAEAAKHQQQQILMSFPVMICGFGFAFAELQSKAHSEKKLLQ